MSSKTLENLKRRLLEKNISSFEEFTFEVFYFQSRQNEIYRQYVDSLGISKRKIIDISDIPFLPIEFFKYHEIKSGSWAGQKKFLSSGTTRQKRSLHEVQDVEFYHQITKMIFEDIYGPIDNLIIMALLPSYLRQGNSSLVEMVDFFMRTTVSGSSGFYLDDYDQLVHNIRLSSTQSERIILFGVSYALLNLANKVKNEKFDEITVIETGGMKGRGEELTRNELHAILKKGIGTDNIHSEYGMTELLSQAYMVDDGHFQSPDWMKIFIRDVNDPFKILENGNTGAINIVDLANIHSCAFIETKDVGKAIDNNRFQVLGRIDNSDIRGCNLLLS